MTIEDIRRKHEGQEKEVRGEPATVTDSDGCPIEKAVLRREWKKFNAYFQAEEKRHKEIDEHITALRARLVQAEGKVERALKIASMRSKYPATMTNYYLEHIEEIEQILRGEP